MIWTSILIYLPLGSMTFLIILQSNPFRKSIATPLEPLLPWASSRGAPHSAFHCLSLFPVECVSWRKMIFSFCFLHHAKIARRFLKLLKPLTFNESILKSLISAMIFLIWYGKNLEDHLPYNTPFNNYLHRSTQRNENTDTKI